MHELLMKFISERGEETDTGRVALQAQIILDGGVQVAGAVSWEDTHYKALSLATSPDGKGSTMVEFYFAAESIRTIILAAERIPAEEPSRIHMPS